MTRPLFDTNWILNLINTTLHNGGNVSVEVAANIGQSREFICSLDHHASSPAGTYRTTTDGICLGLGKELSELKLEDVPKTYGALTRQVIEKHRMERLGFEVHPTNDETIQAAAFGIGTALLQAGFMKTAHSTDYFPGPKEVVIRPASILEGDEAREAFGNAVDKGLELAGFANVQRVLGALGGNILHNESYPEVVKQLCTDTGVEVFEPTREEGYNMGLMLAVNAGSEHPFSVLALKVKSTKLNDAKIAVIVGKGVMFDTGGLNIKTDGHMAEMQADMMGSAAALTTALYFAKHPEELERDLVCVLGIVENRVDSNSYCVEDVLVAYDGRTVQIGNTDAEGRLVLADCCAWICEHLGAGNIDSLTTVATLTGHALLATGGETSVVIARGNDPFILTGIEEASRTCGDPFQRMHLNPCDHAAMESPVADLNNLSGSRERGAMTGAAFVQTFVPAEVKHVIHLDIARATSRKGNKGLVDGIPQFAGPLLLIAAHSHGE